MTGTPAKGLPVLPICGTAATFPPRAQREQLLFFIYFGTGPYLSSSAFSKQPQSPPPASGSFQAQVSETRARRRPSEASGEAPPCPTSVRANLRPAQQVPWGVFSGPGSVGLWAEAKVCAVVT